MKEYLMHYASVYYDPVKAHEYYMKNRELKGKKRSGTLNEEGQAAKKMVKSNLDAERDSKLKGIDSAKESQLSSLKSTKETALQTAQETAVKTLEQAQKARSKDIENHSTHIKNEIKSILEMAKSGNVSDSQKSAMLQKIASLRDENYKKRESINKQFNEKTTKITDDYQNKVTSAHSEYQSGTASAKENAKSQKESTRQEYKDKYEAELDKIYSDSKFLKPKKTKKK